ncbi:MAG: hypothetical protein LQ340_006244 [Diploschistes diacapsis]|nr:MAG: hypothetical protein LQ340_006244 [Diploschistes diacapsis]
MSTRRGGAIDPAGFLDYTGQQYVIYKQNSDSQGLGDTGYYGPCALPSSSPLMIQEVSPTDGVTLVGSPVEMLAPDVVNAIPIRAPSMTRVASASAESGWLYVLFFTSGCEQDGSLAVSYAMSAHGVLGGGRRYERAAGSLLRTGDNNKTLWCPGSATVQLDAQKMLWNSNLNGTDGTRQVFAGEISIDAAAMTVSI